MAICIPGFRDVVDSTVSGVKRDGHSRSRSRVANRQHVYTKRQRVKRRWSTGRRAIVTPATQVAETPSNVAAKLVTNPGQPPAPGAPPAAGSPQPNPPQEPWPPPSDDPPPSPAPAPVPGPAPDPVPVPPPEPSPEPPADGEILFMGTFESGDFSGWYLQSIPVRASTPSSDPFEGGRAARFEVRDGDVEPDTGNERSEVSGPTFDEGQDLYIRDAIRVPSSNTYAAPWQIIQQLHEEDWGGSPGIAVFLDNRPGLKLGAGDSSPIYWQSPPLQTDRWYDLVYRVYLSRDSGAGFVEVWLDGVQQVLSNGLMRMYGQTIQAAQTYIKAGIYRSKFTTGTSIVEHDAIVIGTSLAAVMSAF
jgi:hypothetical protein